MATQPANGTRPVTDEPAVDALPGATFMGVTPDKKFAVFNPDSVLAQLLPPDPQAGQALIWTGTSLAWSDASTGGGGGGTTPTDPDLDPDYVTATAYENDAKAAFQAYKNDIEAA